MKLKPLKVLVPLICIVSIIATCMGILSNEGPGEYTYLSIRGKEVQIYGRGIYKDMSADVAPQGIAQDVVTLAIGVPLLLMSFIMALRGSARARIVLAGTLFYFLVTYLFYLVMGMYNSMFLAYAFLLGASFFSLALVFMWLQEEKISASASDRLRKITGRLLVFIACSIALLWLSVVVPPLFDGSVVPVQVEHYTTLIVQGLDLALLLPLAVVSGMQLSAKTKNGLLFGSVYFVFLSLLMTALTAKVIAMGMLGQNVFPVIIIIPLFNIISIIRRGDVNQNFYERVMA